MEMKIIMNKIKTILICLIIIATCTFCIGLVAINGQKTTVELSKTCSIEVDGDYNLTNIGNGISQLKNSNLFGEKAIIYYFNSENKGFGEIIVFGALKTPLVDNTFDTGVNPVQTTYNGQTVYVCYMANNITHDNILIIAKNRDECIKIYKSIKYNTNKANNNNTTVEHINHEDTSNNKVSESNQQQTPNKKDLSKNTIEDDIAIMKQSRDNGGHYAGLSDEQIEQRAQQYHNKRSHQ